MASSEPGKSLTGDDAGPDCPDSQGPGSVAEQGLEGCGQPFLVGGGGPAAVTGEISVNARAGQDKDHVNRAVVGQGGRGRQADQIAAVGEPGLAGGAPESGVA